MKIGLICPYHIFRSGGVQECVLAIQAELKRRGHDAKIITPLPRDADYEDRNDIIFVGASTDVKSFFNTTAQVSVNLDTDALKAMLDEEQFDVLHFHEPWVPIMSRQVLTRSNAANVATFHAKLPETIMSKTIEKVITPYTKSVMKYLDVLTAVSEAAAGYVRSLTTDQINIVPNGIDLAKYQPNKTSVAHEKKQLLFIGRLEKRKGVKYLLDAFAQYQVNDPHAILVIAGDGPDRSKLEDYVRTSKIHNVEFKGFISEHEKQQLLSRTDLFVSPAPYGESFGIVLLEAMASGVVTIAGDNPGYASVLTGRGAISLVSPKDTSQFARRIELLLHDQDIRSLWREWALNEAKRYSYSNVVDQYEKLYSEARKRHKLAL